MSETKQVAATPAPATSNPAALRKFQEQTVDAILTQVGQLQELGAIQIPENYSVGNQLKLAWLRLLEATDRNQKPVLEVCTHESICNALLEMVIQGLSVAKKQVDFIAYGNRLTLQREYHGTIALAMRVGGVSEVPVGAVVYQDDEFEFAINPKTGRRQIIKHIQSIANIDPNKIVAAYAVIPLSNGETHVEIMTIQQIKQAWMQGATKGQSPAHRNFPDQMAIKTVISRGCKLFISSSSDAGLINVLDEEPAETTFEEKKSKQPAKKDLKPVMEISAAKIESREPKTDRFVSDSTPELVDVPEKESTTPDWMNS